MTDWNRTAKHGSYQVLPPSSALKLPLPHLPFPQLLHRNTIQPRQLLRPLVLPDGLTGMTYTREGEILKCPWHQWEFYIKTGQALYDPKLRVRTYRVEVDGAQIVLYA